MTFRDLQKLMEQEQSTESNSKEMQDLTQKVRDRPFYIWSGIKHKPLSNPNNTIQGRCCFNHIIGLPKKNGVPQPPWNYQDQIYRCLTIPGYLNTVPSAVGGVTHNLEEKKEKEQVREEHYLHAFNLNICG
jgi:hypothetical protein